MAAATELLEAMLHLVHVLNRHGSAQNDITVQLSTRDLKALREALLADPDLGAAGNSIVTGEELIEISGVLFIGRD